MKLKLEQLTSHLAQSLAPGYLISGDELVLADQACQNIRNIAQQKGFEVTRTITVDSASFDWGSLWEQLQTPSLFSEKTFLDVHVVNGKPGKAGGEWIRACFEQPSPDRCLLVRTPKLDKSSQKTAWVQAFEKQGVHLALWPLRGGQLAAWLRGRCEAAGLQVEPPALQWAVTNSQGDLLALANAVEILALLNPPVVTQTHMAQALFGEGSDVDAFSLSDALLYVGPDKFKKIAQCFHHLQTNGTDPVLVLWSVHRHFAALTALHAQQKNRQPLAPVFQRFKIWPSQQNLYVNVLQDHVRRGAVAELGSVLAQCFEVEQVVKGMKAGDAYGALFRLLQPLPHI